MQQPGFDHRRSTYYCRFQVQGTRRYFNLGPDLKAATRELRRLSRLWAGQQWSRMRPSTGVATAGQNMSLHELAHRHLEWVQANRAKSTYDARRFYVNDFLRFTGQSIRQVSELTPALMHEFFAWAKSKPNCRLGTNGGIAHLRHVKTMLLWADRWEICANPIRRFPEAHEERPPTRLFSDIEFRMLLGAVPDDFRDLLLFGVLTGLRPRELRELKKEHLAADFAGNVFIRVEQHKTSKSSRAPRPRTVPLSATANEILMRQLQKHPESVHVFLDGNGKPYDGDTLRRRMTRWCERVKIKPRSPYALRHMFATGLAASQVNQTLLAHLMGHARLETTSRYVAHVDAHYRGAVDAGEALVQRLLSTPAGKPRTSEPGNSVPLIRHAV